MPQHQTQVLSSPAFLTLLAQKLENTLHRLWEKISCRLPRPKYWFSLGWFGGVQIYPNRRHS
jgi:hypothetical protein